MGKYAMELIKNQINNVLEGEVILNKMDQK